MATKKTIHKYCMANGTLKKSTVLNGISTRGRFRFSLKIKWALCCVAYRTELGSAWQSCDGRHVWAMRIFSYSIWLSKPPTTSGSLGRTNTQRPGSRENIFMLAVGRVLNSFSHPWHVCGPPFTCMCIYLLFRQPSTERYRKESIWISYLGTKRLYLSIKAFPA
jgi:hypothetical protein